jgi:hypothetical protein
MKILLLLITLEMGIVPSGHLRTYHETPSRINMAVSMYIKSDFELQMFNNNWFIGGEIISYFWKSKSGKGFSPTDMNFILKTGFRYKWLEIGYRHNCLHPVIAYLSSKGINLNYEHSYDEIYIQATIRTKGIMK